MFFFVGGLSPDDLEGPMFGNVVKSLMVVVSRLRGIYEMEKPLTILFETGCGLLFVVSKGP
jgi:hypothetical protein